MHNLILPVAAVSALAYAVYEFAVALSPAYAILMKALAA